MSPDDQKSNEFATIIDELRQKAAGAGRDLYKRASAMTGDIGATVRRASAHAAKSTAKIVARKSVDVAAKAAHDAKERVKQYTEGLQPDDQRSQKYAIVGRMVGEHAEAAVKGLQQQLCAIKKDAEIVYDDWKLEQKVPGMKSAIELMLENYEINGEAIFEPEFPSGECTVASDEKRISVSYARESAARNGVLSLLSREPAPKTHSDGSITLYKSCGSELELAHLYKMRILVAETLDRVVGFDRYTAHGVQIENEAGNYSLDVDVSGETGQRNASVKLSVVNERGELPLVMAYAMRDLAQEDASDNTGE
jgi:hypothetical protein